MKIDHKYIYLRRHNSFACSYKVKYDFKKIWEMINEYSIKNGATIVNKTFLGSIRTWENGRIISEKETIFPKSNKIIGLSLGANSQYDYVILENESEFIKNLLKSFQRFEFPIACHPYVLLNFSKIINMLKNNELSDEDIKFLGMVFKEINIDYKSCNSYILPHGTINVETDALKNSYILNLVNKINTLGDNNLQNTVENNIESTTLFEETELNEIREKYSSIDPMPLERQQELFDEIVLGKKKEEIKSLKLKKDENN